ncbi:MAG: DUF2085 domain-containing protein [Bacteroidota bacterium]
MNLALRFLITLLLAFWLLGIFLEWLLPIIPQLSLFVPFLQKSYSLVCHQQHNKLLSNSIYHSFVCSRCAGIYAGLFASSIIALFFPFRSEPSIKFILSALILMLADVLLCFIGVYSYSKSLAFITGLLLGSAGIIYFYSALKKLIIELNSKKN